MTKVAAPLFFFGGTFDPPHHGHYKMARYVLDRFQGSRVIVMPAASAPLRADDRLFSFRERFTLLRALFAKEVTARRIILSPLERLLPKPNYTFDTLAALHKHCDEKPVVMIGADQAQKLGSWHRSAELAHEYEFLVFARQGAVPAQIPNLRAQFVENFADDISATALRARLTALPASERMKQALAQGNPPH